MSAADSRICPVDVVSLYDQTESIIGSYIEKRRPSGTTLFYVY